MSTTASTPVVSLVDGHAVTTSTEVARVFGKRHDLVLRDIRNLAAQLPDADRLLNFAETVETRANPSGGAPIESPAYRLTRDGFTLLAMGFTGKRALAFKLAYIDAFNKMEADLKAKPNSNTHDGLVMDRLTSGRWCLSFDYENRMQITAIAPLAVMIDPRSLAEMEIIVREQVPLANLSRLIHIAVERLTESAGVQK